MRSAARTACRAASSGARYPSYRIGAPAGGVLFGQRALPSSRAGRHAGPDGHWRAGRGDIGPVGSSPPPSPTSPPRWPPAPRQPSRRHRRRRCPTGAVRELRLRALRGGQVRRSSAPAAGRTAGPGPVPSRGWAGPGRRPAAPSAGRRGDAAFRPVRRRAGLVRMGALHCGLLVALTALLFTGLPSCPVFGGAAPSHGLSLLAVLLYPSPRVPNSRYKTCNGLRS